MDCSICLDALDSGVVALPCGHRFHAACLAQCAGGGGHGCDHVPARHADGVPELSHNFARGAGGDVRVV